MTLRYVKTYGSWMVSYAQPIKGELGVEYSGQRRTLFEYVYYGSYKIGEAFSDSYKTITKDGKEYNMVQHSGSGFRYLADAKAVSNLESSDLNESMDALAAEEGF